MAAIDKIRAEIKKRLKNTRDYMNGAGMKYKGPKYYKAQGKESAYDALLNILDTLPDEPITTCNELEEAAMNYIAPIENEDGLKVINFSGRDIKDAFIAGAEWGANHLRDTTKKISEDLKEAAKEYAEEQAFWWIRENPYTSQEYAFKEGAEWQKRKMIGEAYEEEVQEVYRDDDGIHCSVSVGTDYKPGTIVYVITIPKEDEQ